MRVDSNNATGKTEIKKKVKKQSGRREAMQAGEISKYSLIFSFESKTLEAVLLMKMSIQKTGEDSGR